MLLRALLSVLVNTVHDWISTSCCSLYLLNLIRAEIAATIEICYRVPNGAIIGNFLFPSIINMVQNKISKLLGFPSKKAHSASPKNIDPKQSWHDLHQIVNVQQKVDMITKPYLCNVSVSKDHRRKGLGRILVRIMEEIVRGRALDRYATMASRETINAIKNEAVREAFNTNGRADFALDVPEITDDIDYLRTIIIRLREGDYVSSDGSYEFDLDADDEQRKTSDIYVNITLPPRYDEDYSFMSRLVAELKETFRHELEHSSQSTEELMAVQRAVPDREVWKDLETAEDYYLSDAEVKAHVAGIYKKAKSFRKPATNVLERVLNIIYNTGLYYEHDPAKLAELMEKVQTRWADYLFDRYPRAQ